VEQFEVFGDDLSLVEVRNPPRLQERRIGPAMDPLPMLPGQVALPLGGGDARGDVLEDVDLGPDGPQEAAWTAQAVEDNPIVPGLGERVTGAPEIRRETAAGRLLAAQIEADEPVGDRPAAGKGGGDAGPLGSSRGLESAEVGLPKGGLERLERFHLGFSEPPGASGIIAPNGNALIAETSKILDNPYLRGLRDGRRELAEFLLDRVCRDLLRAVGFAWRDALRAAGPRG
jgi:hypothetical protein